MIMMMMTHSLSWTVQRIYLKFKKSKVQDIYNTICKNYK